MAVSEEVVKAILGSIDESIHVVDENGITIYYNQVAAEHDGLQIEEVVGKHVFEAFPSLTEESSTLLKAIRTKQAIYNQPQTYRNIRGRIIDTVNSTIPIEVNGRTIGAIEVAKDYSKIKLLSNMLIDLQSKIKRDPKKLKEGSGAKYRMDHIITRNRDFQKVKNDALKVAKTASTVLVYGETGTGKELLVQSIHSASRRNQAPFIAQNCAALPESLLESILFGTVKGSYTGAVDRAGLFELAHGGTLFLDEINSMPLEMQSRLLRVLEDGQVRRIGSSKTVQVDVRVIVALNQHPLICMEEKQFRPDLFYRLNVFSLEIPPLRERKEDIPFLVDHFIKGFNNDFYKNVTKVSKEVYTFLQNFDWPGNVRELKHVVEHAMNLVEDSTITEEHLPSSIKGSQTSSIQHEIIQPLRDVMFATEKNLIEKALHVTEGNINQAAKLLQIPRQTLQYKLQKQKG